MCAAAKGLSHFVGDRSHVGPGGNARAEVNPIRLDAEDFQFLDLHLDRFQNHFLLLASQLVSRHSIDFLGGKGRGNLLDHTAEARR